MAGVSKVLITGAQGFTGKYLIPYLQKRGFEVFSFEGEITSNETVYENLRNCHVDAIVHLAALSFVEENPYELYRVNLLGTQNLLRAAIDNKVKKFIFASSATVYGRQDQHILSEDLCPNPQNHYAISKFGAEQLIRSQNEIDYVIVRPFNYTGVGQSLKFVVPKIVSHFKRKAQTIELGNIEAIREFNSVLFVCEAYTRILEKNIKNETLNIASSRGASLKEIIELLEEISAHHIEVVQNPKFMRSNDIPILIGDKRKMVDLLGEMQQESLYELLYSMYEMDWE